MKYLHIYVCQDKDPFAESVVIHSGITPFTGRSWQDMPNYQASAASFPSCVHVQIG